MLNLICTTDKLRLVGGVETGNTLSGRLEVLINGEWGTVCDDGWDINDAHVACRELGYSYALSYQCCAQYGRGSGRVWLDNVGCSGEEDSLLNCSHHGIGVLRSCSHWDDVGVVCYKPGTCTVYAPHCKQKSIIIINKVPHLYHDYMQLAGKWFAVLYD